MYATVGPRETGEMVKFHFRSNPIER